MHLQTCADIQVEDHAALMLNTERDCIVPCTRHSCQSRTLMRRRVHKPYTVKKLVNQEILDVDWVSATKVLQLLQNQEVSIMCRSIGRIELPATTSKNSMCLGHGQTLLQVPPIMLSSVSFVLSESDTIISDVQGDSLA